MSSLASATLHHKHSYTLTQTTKTAHLGVLNESLSNSKCATTTASLQCGDKLINLCSSTNSSSSLLKIQPRNMLEGYKIITVKVQYTHTACEESFSYPDCGMEKDF